jgi:VIT1/CCC1 family predicted Fe2+/Mn2+ transporter
MKTNTWYQDIEKKISSLREKMAGDESNIKQLDIILKVAKKVEKHSPKCGECSDFQDDINNVVDGLKEWPDITDKQNENYISTFKNATKHLTNIHDKRKRRSFLIGIACGIGGLLLLFPYTFTALAEIKVLPFILLALVFLLFVGGLVFIIDSYTPILPRGK